MSVLGLFLLAASALGLGHLFVLHSRHLVLCSRMERMERIVEDTRAELRAIHAHLRPEDVHRAPKPEMAPGRVIREGESKPRERVIGFVGIAEPLGSTRMIGGPSTPVVVSGRLDLPSGLGLIE